MPTWGLRKRMPLGSSLSAAKCISPSPVAGAHGGDVVGIERAAAEDDDAAGGLADQRGEQLGAFGRRVALAAGQHAADAGADQRLERFGRIARHVESAMAGDGQRPGGLDQRAHARLVDVPSAVRQPTTTPATPRSRNAATSATIEANSAAE